MPQGSLLGPLLFLIYINDLALEPLKYNLDMYADDGTLYSSDVSIKCIEPNLQHDLAIVDKWFTLNNMSVNPSKTICRTIGPQRKLSKLIELSLSVIYIYIYIYYTCVDVVVGGYQYLVIVFILIFQICKC